MQLDGRHSLHHLAGGARLVTAAMPARSSASVVFQFGVGSRYEDARLSGVSHFIEHLLFKGTERRPTAKDIAEAIEGVGGTMNASTDKEMTSYWIRVPADRLGLGLDVLFDMVAHSRLTPEDVDRERMVILEEIKMYEDQPQDYVHSLFEELMWPEHPLGREITGTVETVSAMSREDLSAYLHDHYRLANLVIGVTGGIDEAEARELVEAQLGLPAEAGPEARLDPPPPLEKPGLKLHEKKTEQAHICLGTRALSYFDPDRHILDLINTMLGEGMSSRLFLEIREERGLAYDVHSYTSKHHDSGYFGVYLGVDPKNAQEAVAAVVAELHKVPESGVPAEELSKAKEYTKGRMMMSLESTSAMANWLSQQQLLMGRIRTLEEIIAEVEAVTIEDVVRVAERVMLAPLQSAVIGPFKSEAPFLAALGA